MLTAEDQSLIQKTWNKVEGNEEEFGSCALLRCRPGPGTPWARRRAGGSSTGASGGGLALTLLLRQVVHCFPPDQDLLPPL